MGVNIGQINMARCLAGMEDLRRYLENSDIQVLLIQETYARPTITWAGCRIFHGAEPNEDIWTLTVVRVSKLSAVLNVGLSSTKCTVVEIENLEKPYETVISVNAYFRYSEDIEPHLTGLDNIVSAYGDRRCLVISADTNARSTLWFNEFSDARGASLECFILMHDSE